MNRNEPKLVCVYVGAYIEEKKIALSFNVVLVDFDQEVVALS